MCHAVIVCRAVGRKMWDFRTAFRSDLEAGGQSLPDVSGFSQVMNTEAERYHVMLRNYPLALQMNSHVVDTILYLDNLPHRKRFIVKQLVSGSKSLADLKGDPLLSRKAIDAQIASARDFLARFEKLDAASLSQVNLVEGVMVEEPSCTDRHPILQE